MAVVRSVKKLKTYLLGIKFVIYSDCKAFEQTVKKRDLCTRISRWALILGEYDCEVVHKKRTAMKHVDALSRYSVMLSIETGILQQVKNEQGKGVECTLLKEILTKPYKKFVLRNGIVYNLDDGNYLLVLPKNMQKNILYAVFTSVVIFQRRRFII